MSYLANKILSLSLFACGVHCEILFCVAYPSAASCLK